MDTKIHRNTQSAIYHEQIKECKFCESSMKHLGGYFPSSNSTHMMCTNHLCKAHFYTPTISSLENKYAEGKWYTAKEWEHEFELPLGGNNGIL